MSTSSPALRITIGGVDYLGEAPPNVGISPGGPELSAAVTADMDGISQRPDALCWDDLAMDFYPRQKRLRAVRTWLPNNDPLLLQQVNSAGRCLVRADLLRDLHQRGDIAIPTDTDGALRHIAAQAGPIQHLTTPLRFVGHALWDRVTRPLTVRPTAKAQSVGVIVSYRDHADVTLACLEHLARQRLTSALDVIVVDNQSVPAQRALVDAGLERLFGGRPACRYRHILFDAPFNLSYQNNMAAVVTDAQVLLLLNNECMLIDSDCVQTLADWSLEPGVGTVAPRMVGQKGRLFTAGVNAGLDSATGKRRVWECEFPYLSNIIRRTAANSTACVAVTRANWFAVGGMDACAFPSQYDDTDLCFRMAKIGLRHLYAGNVTVFHEPGTSEERKREAIAARMELLMARHDPVLFDDHGPRFQLADKLSAFVHPFTLQWLSLYTCYRGFVGYQKTMNGQPMPEQIAAHWCALEKLSAIIASMPQSRDDSQKQEERDQTSLLATAINLCRSYIEVNPSLAKKHAANLDIMAAEFG